MLFKSAGDITAAAANAAVEAVIAGTGMPLPEAVAATVAAAISVGVAEAALHKNSQPLMT